MKLIITFFLVLVTSMFVKAQNNPTFQLIDPHTNTSWTAGTMEAIVWKYASEKNELINSIELITPNQNVYLFKQQGAVPLSCEKYNWMVPSEMIATDQASIVIVTDTVTYKTEFNFNIKSRNKRLFYSDYFVSATASQPDPNIYNPASSANYENNNLKHTAVFIVLFNLSIFLWI